MSATNEPQSTISSVAATAGRTIRVGGAAVTGEA
jgi:hypothetical protein